MKNEDELRIQEKIDFFFAEKCRIHIKRKDKRFWNGIIIEKKNDSVFIMKERELGLVHLFISDVHDVEEYKEEEK